MIRFVLATDDLDFESRLRQAFQGDLNGHLRRVPNDFLQHPAQAVSAVTVDPAAVPDVVALGPGLPSAAALELARRFDEDHPEINVVIVALPTPRLLEEALRAGARDVVSPEASPEELRTVFQRASENAARRRAHLTGEASGPSARIIALASPKGGSGKTTVASNLAVGLAMAAPGRVAMVDLDLQFGDVGSALQLLPEHSIADAAESLATLDPMGLKVFLTPHPSGLHVLCAPDSPAEGDQVTSDAAARMLRLLATEFSYIVVDTCAGLNENTLAAFEVATDILFVCTMDVSSVRSLRKEIQALDQLGMHAPQRHFVLNRAQSRVGLEPGDVERTVGLPIDVAVPSSRAVPLSMNQGVPVVQSDPRSPVAKSVRQLVHRFAGRPAVQSGWFTKQRSSR
jgi:pilus assembly protein CpaE